MFKAFNAILSLIFMIIKMSGVPNDLQKYNFLKILLKIKVKFTHLNKIKLP